MKRSSRMTRRPLDPADVLGEVASPGSGATVLFVGTVRDNSEAGEVDRIFYDSYLPLAEKRMRDIEDEVRKIWPVNGISVRHRVGDLKVGETSVVVAVSAPHRAAAFDACRHAIERIKHDVPIWKMERLADGRNVWVEGHAMRTRSALKARS